jgi:hypothetical protein
MKEVGMTSCFSLFELQNVTEWALGLSNKTTLGLIPGKRRVGSLHKHFPLLCPRLGPTFVEKLPFRVDDGYWTTGAPAYIGENFKGCHRQVL